MREIDVVIVGGSLAGAACAIELGRRGIEALAFERDRFPRRKVCGAFLSPGALVVLRDLGVFDEIRARGARRIGRVRLSAGSTTHEFPLSEPGFGFSRWLLDSILAREARVFEGHSVERIQDGGRGRRFLVDFRTGAGAPERVACRMVVDAAGRFSRFTRRIPRSQFGVQFPESRDTGPVLEFGFFDWGYGGTVGVEDGGANSCFLADRSMLGTFLRREDCAVVGAVAYARRPGPYLAVGDASGMIDPFSGEGMRHALESGRMAGEWVAEGFGRGWSYQTTRERYESAHDSRWAAKRRAGAILRWWLRHPGMARRIGPCVRFPGLAGMLVERLWAV